MDTLDIFDENQAGLSYSAATAESGDSYSLSRDERR